MASKNDNEYQATGYGEASASEVRQIFTCCYEANMPVMLVGDPGVGKTALINAWCRENNLGEPIILIGSQMEPQDIAGLPMASDIDVNGKKMTVTEYGAPWWQIELLSGRRKVLFLDEFSNSPATIQSGELKLVGDRVFGNGEKLPDDTFIVMAMNPESSAVDYTPIAAPMANRIMFVSYKPTDREVYDGLTGGWFTEDEKEAWTDSEVKWRDRIVSFLRSTNGAYILQMNHIADGAMDSSAPAWLSPDSENSDSEREILTTAWPSPRAWDNIARVLGKTGFEKLVTPLQERMLTGTVGRPATVFLMQYVQEHSHIDPFELIKHPEKQEWRVSSDDGATYNDIAEIARSINEVIPKCDGTNGRPTEEEALEFYDKVIDLGGGPHFAPVFSRGENSPAHYFRQHVPNEYTQGEWSDKIVAILVKLRKNDLITSGRKTTSAKK